MVCMRFSTKSPYDERELQPHVYLHNIVCSSAEANGEIN